MWKIWDKPDFKHDHEETAWWVALQDRFMSALREAEKDGSIGRGGVARRLGLAPGSMLTLDPEDAALAKTLAAQVGLDFQTYVRSLLHTALLAASEKQHPVPSAYRSLTEN